MAVSKARPEVQEALQKNGNGKVAKPPTNAETPTKLLELKKKQLRVRIKGITSLICHAWSAKAIKMMQDKQAKAAARGREIRNPEDDMKACFYTDSSGRACFPASGIKKAIVSAATSIDDKTYSKVKLRQGLFVNGDMLPLILGKEPHMRTDPVRVGRGAADIRYRPEFTDWAIDLDITYNESVFSAEQIVNLVNLAGFAVGIGDWRPERDGNFGRWEVVNA